MNVLRIVAARILLTSIYGFTWLVAAVGGIVPRRVWKPTGRIMVTGTFHNPNWYLSHITPLSLCGLKEVLLIADTPQLPLERVRFLCPPRWLARVLTRAGAKAVWTFLSGLRYRPDLYMGYHLLPGACTALMVGRLLGRPSCYQMTGGPAGIIGGGFAAVDSIEGTLGRPSRLVEALAIAVVRQFDLVVVRGEKARKFLADWNITGSVAVITGSVNGCRPSPRQERDLHLIYVGRLAAIKQVDQVLAVVSAVRQTLSDVRAVVVGDGPKRADLQACAAEMGIAGNVEFVGKRKDIESFLARSRVFLLTSKSEGLSIALAESMTAGVVPVVANVGDLGDLVVDGRNGYLIEPNCIDEYAAKAVSLLRDEALWARCSREAIEAARGHCGIEVVSEKWRQHLQRAISQSPRCLSQEVLE